MAAPARNTLGNQGTVIAHTAVKMGRGVLFNNTGEINAVAQVGAVALVPDAIALYDSAKDLPVSVHFGPGWAAVEIGGVDVSKGDEIVTNATGKWIAATTGDISSAKMVADAACRQPRTRFLFRARSTSSRVRNFSIHPFI